MTRSKSRREVLLGAAALAGTAGLPRTAVAQAKGRIVVGTWGGDYARLLNKNIEVPILIKDGFEVFPYCTEDLSVAMRLVDAGCKVVMPWAAPIGSAKGIINRDALKLLRDRLPDIALVVDAGLGAPSHAAEAMELGYDAVLLNTAIAKAAEPVAMAGAFRLGVEAGRAAYEAGLMEARNFASPSTPVVGTPFWHAVS